MATTGEDIFQAALQLMDEAGSNAATGRGGYESRVVPILNILRYECAPYGQKMTSQVGGVRTSIVPLVSLTDTVDLDDGLAQSALPYGLAAHLLLDEDASLCAYFDGRYQRLLAVLGATLPAVSGDIVNVYGGVALVGEED